MPLCEITTKTKRQCGFAIPCSYINLVKSGITKIGDLNVAAAESHHNQVVVIYKKITVGNSSSPSISLKVPWYHNKETGKENFSYVTHIWLSSFELVSISGIYNALLIKELPLRMVFDSS